MFSILRWTLFFGLLQPALAYPYAFGFLQGESRTMQLQTKAWSGANAVLLRYAPSLLDFTAGALWEQPLESQMSHTQKRQRKGLCSSTWIPFRHYNLNGRTVGHRNSCKQ